jgi:hypothetical protein
MLSNEHDDIDLDFKSHDESQNIYEYYSEKGIPGIKHIYCYYNANEPRQIKCVMINDNNEHVIHTIDKQASVERQKQEIETYKKPISITVRIDSKDRKTIKNVFYNFYENGNRAGFGGGGKKKTPYEKRTVTELRDLATKRKIKGASKMRKAELIAALRVKK